MMPLERISRALGRVTDLGGLAQVLDGPDDGEQDGAAADDVDQVQDVAPREEGARGGRVGVQYYNRHLTM